METTVLILLILLLALLTLTEAAVAASKPTRLEQVAKTGSRRARSALRLLENPQRLLSTVRCLLVLLLVAIGVLTQVIYARPVREWMNGSGISEAIAGPLASILAMLGIAMVALFVGDVLPRRLAALAPEAIALTLARPMRAVTIALSPIVGLTDAVGGLIVKIFGTRPEQPAVTDMEIRELMDEGARTGVFEKAEHDIVTNVFRLADRRASALMTPRTEIDWIDIAATQDQIRELLSGHPHSHFPIGQGSLDHVVGVLASKDVLSRAFSGETVKLSELMQRPLIVPESVSALQLLESFRESPQQVALIADEYGSILGMVSQDDVLEAIVGDLASPTSPEEQPLATRREDGSWLVDASMPADEFKDLLEIDDLPGENEYDTVGGFVLMQLQRIPRAGDRFTWEKLRVEVMDMDGKRIDKVLVGLNEAGEASEAGASEKSE